MYTGEVPVPSGVVLVIGLPPSHAWRRAPPKGSVYGGAGRANARTEGVAAKGRYIIYVYAKLPCLNVCLNGHVFNYYLLSSNSYIVYFIYIELAFPVYDLRDI